MFSLEGQKLAWPKTGRSNWSRTQVEAYASTAPVQIFDSPAVTYSTKSASAYPPPSAEVEQP